MREKLHRILDLVLELNMQGATHANVDFSGKVEMVYVVVWEGEYEEKNILFKDYTYYDGELRDEAKVNEIIRTLEELKGDI